MRSIVIKRIQVKETHPFECSFPKHHIINLFSITTYSKSFHFHSRRNSQFIPPIFFAYPIRCPVSSSPFVQHHNTIPINKTMHLFMSATISDIHRAQGVSIFLQNAVIMCYYPCVQLMFNAQIIGAFYMLFLLYVVELVDKAVHSILKMF